MMVERGGVIFRTVQTKRAPCVPSPLQDHVVEIVKKVVPKFGVTPMPDPS